jgi:hypothetical protein
MVEPSPHTFDEAQLQIYTLMHRDSYPRFINSQIYRRLLRSEDATTWWMRAVRVKTRFSPFFCLHDTFHSVDAPLSRRKNKSNIKFSFKHFFRGCQMPIYIIAAIESKCFYICIFFYNLDIWFFSYARATFDSPSLDCDEFLFYFSSFVFCCVCVCVYMRVLFSFSLLFSRLRLHLNEQWHWMPSYCLHVCFVA